MQSPWTKGFGGVHEDSVALTMILDHGNAHNVVDFIYWKYLIMAQDMATLWNFKIVINPCSWDAHDLI